ncbi:LIL3 [Auxenochlorella protothecoides x Auxenochlorella symbiontica]
MACLNQCPAVHARASSASLKGAAFSRTTRAVRGPTRTVTHAGAAENNTVNTATIEKKDRKASPLLRGGTLQGEAAAGKDASDKFKAMAAGESTASLQPQVVDGKFTEPRWKEGRWVLESFRDSKGNMDWDAVITAEMTRRRMLEGNPIPSVNEDPVRFDTSEIPWWAWVRRFHLPEAEKLNGRAAMLGYFLALGVDKLTGVGLLDQQESFLGKVVLHVAVFGVLLFRTTGDFNKYKNLFDEATFYDKQWKASWEGQVRPSEKE